MVGVGAGVCVPGREEAESTIRGGEDVGTPGTIQGGNAETGTNPGTGSTGDRSGVRGILGQERYGSQTGETTGRKKYQTGSCVVTGKG